MQLGRRGAGLNTDFFMVRNISSLFMLYCLDPGLDNRDTKAKKIPFLSLRELSSLEEKQAYEELHCNIVDCVKIEAWY